LGGSRGQPHRQRAGTERTDEPSDGEPAIIKQRIGHRRRFPVHCRRDLSGEAREQEVDRDRRMALGRAGTVFSERDRAHAETQRDPRDSVPTFMSR
jgi:hypothetical protein